MPPTCARRCAPRKATSCCRSAIDEAIGRKPKGHDFIIDRRTNRPAVVPPHERDRRLTVGVAAAAADWPKAFRLRYGRA